MKPPTHADLPRSRNLENRPDASTLPPRIHMVYLEDADNRREPLPDVAEMLNALGIVPRTGEVIDTEDGAYPVAKVFYSLVRDDPQAPYGTVNVIV